MNHRTSSLFYFSKSERIGICILLFLLISQWALRLFWTQTETASPYWRKLQLVSLDDPKNQQIISAYLYDSTWGVDAQQKARIEINHADSAQLEGLPMIGGFLAQRIVRYRDALGGYYSLTQLLEIPQLKESTWEAIYPQLTCNKKVRKIDLNHTTIDELVQHPYISYIQAQRLVRFREQHGNFKTIEEIKATKSIPDTTWSKMVHYLALDSTHYDFK
jgi:DNA uptake protein ComE-like DNA-binding protein